jgi:hypothetical protein
MSIGRILGLLALSTILFLSVSTQSLYGQDGDITLQIQLSDPVTQAQVLSLSTLGVDRRGQGQTLGTLLLQNNNASELQEGVPGIRNPTFSGGLTDAGEQFVNDLEGTSRLPNEQFTLTLEIYQNGNRGRGTKVASTSATVRTNAVSNVRDIYINRPGGEVGSGFDATINTQRPTFNWAGETGVDYRLVVVRWEGTDSPEPLIEAAEDTEPIIVNNANRNNTLLEHEMADVRLSSNSFLPRLIGISGVPSLVDGGLVTVPTFRQYGPDGEWFPEGEGVDPDIRVENTPQPLARGDDPQLQRAIEEMQRALENYTPPQPDRPPYENRTPSGGGN